MKIVIKRHCVRGTSVLSVTVLCMSPALCSLVQRVQRVCRPGCSFSMACQFSYASASMALRSLPACMVMTFILSRLIMASIPVFLSG